MKLAFWLALKQPLTGWAGINFSGQWASCICAAPTPTTISLAPWSQSSPLIASSQLISRLLPQHQHHHFFPVLLRVVLPLLSSRSHAHFAQRVHSLVPFLNHHTPSACQTSPDNTGHTSPESRSSHLTFLHRQSSIRII